MILSIKRFFALCLMALSFMAGAAEPLNINTATAKQLALVMSGVGEAKAAAIVSYRDANGDFTSVNQLTDVKGIGAALLEKNRDLLQVNAPE